MAKKSKNKKKKNKLIVQRNGILPPLGNNYIMKIITIVFK